MNRRRWCTLIGTTLKVGVILLCFAYVFRLLWTNFDELQHTQFRLRLLPLLASLPFAVGYLLGRAAIWHLIVRRMIGTFPLHTDMACWLGSIVGKYIPGKVFLLLGRVYIYRRHGATAPQVGVSVVLESCCSCMAAAAVFGLAIFSGRFESALPLNAAVATPIVATVIGAVPILVYFGIKLGLKLLPRTNVKLSLGLGDMYLWTVVMILNWLLLGIGFYLLLLALIDLPWSLLPYITGAFAVAGLAGVLALFAPSGIGVREGVMTAVLAGVLPGGIAAVAALIARIWMTLAEAICSGCALLAIRYSLSPSRDIELGQQEAE